MSDEDLIFQLLKIITERLGNSSLTPEQMKAVAEAKRRIDGE